MDSTTKSSGDLTWTIGNHLYRICQENHYTVERFAELLSVSPRTVGYWFAGQKRPSIETLLFVKARFGVTLDDLTR
jgi:transcriptional regulator with XRE-family HTH domain